MSSETKRYLIHANGPEVEPIETALSLLAELCESFESPKDAILLIPAKKQFRGTSLETVLGSRMTEALLKGEPVGLPNGGNLRLESQRTFQGSWTSDIILGVYVTKKMLDQIDSARNAVAVIVIPWIMDDVTEWRRTWNPQVPGEAQAVSEALVESCVVEEALRMLTDRVNLSTGLSHPSDRAAAVELFRLLSRHKEPYDPDSIRAWALRNSWTPEGANQLRAVAQAILDRRPLRGGRHPHWSPDIMKVLHERARGH